MGGRLFIGVACLFLLATAGWGFPKNSPRKKSTGPIAASPSIWPQPQFNTSGSTTIFVSPALTFTGDATRVPTLQKAIARYSHLIFDHANIECSATNLLSTVSVSLGSTDETLQMSTSEAYTLNVGDAGGSGIVADTVYGAVHALETLSQLITFDFDSGCYVIAQAPWAIKDFPRFRHRGLLLDTSRHFHSLHSIKRVIDGMSFSKLNVLHWHIVDAQAFPLEIKSYSKLWAGAWSPAERYTQGDVADIVEYARLRAVRVMVEVDGPGHTYAWGIGYPEVLPEGFSTAQNCHNVCPPVHGDACNVPVDPSLNMTYQILDGIISELAGPTAGQGLFPEQLFHLGGDEVESACWSNSPRINAWMKQMNYTSLDQAYMYYVHTAQLNVLGRGRAPVHWEEVFNHFGTALDKSVIIHVWLDKKTLASVVSQGYRGILSDGNWYLDHLDVTWDVAYLNEPLESVAANDTSLVLGGEACMWSETVDSSDLDSTVWPRAAAVAERLWSDRSVADVNAAAPRMAYFRCLLNKRGIGAAPFGANARTAPSWPGACYEPL